VEDAIKKQATAIVKTLRQKGFTAYFAGGCVRDLILGTPPKDYDIATDARPDQVQEIFPKSKSVGAHFGVILVRRNEVDYEIATFRKDGEYLDGRRPDSVVFTTSEEDAQRRDFTINGLFFNPENETLIDHVNGQKDLETRVVRAIGDPQERFAEDHLRLLRAVRFATVLEFEIEKETWENIRIHATDIGKIAPERTREEIVKILVHPNRQRGFDLLVDSGLMNEIFPEILMLQGCEQPPQWHPEGDVFVHTRIMLGLLPPDASLTLVLSVLFHDIGKPATFTYDEEAQRIRFNGHDQVGANMTDGILRRLRFTNEIIDTTVEAVANHMVFKDVQKMRTSRLKRFMARDGFEDELELHRVDCTSSNGLLDNHTFVLKKIEDFASEPLIPPRLVKGQDLINRGWQPGPRFREVLDAIQNAQLEGTLTTRDEALEFVETHFPD